MHEDRCGVRAIMKTDDTGELEYMRGAKVVKLPRGRGGPDVSKAFEEMRERMKGCGSTLWMLAGDVDAAWGPTFDLGMAVSHSEIVPGAPRYTLLL
jgi:hypothetical protein